MSDMTLCLPREDSFLNRQAQVEQDHPDWKLIPCPVCGDGCYISPDHEYILAGRPTMRADCTICALLGR